MFPAFRAAVGTCLGNWNALQFAVQQQAGGPESKSIADWMVGVVEQFFYENESLDPEEVGDFLATLMDQELNTEVQDQSEDELGQHLCRFFKMCAANKESDVLEEISKMPKFALGNVVIREETSESCANAPVEMETGMSGLQLNEEEAIQEPPRELTELEKQQMQDEAEGWTVKRKGKKGR